MRVKLEYSERFWCNKANIKNQQKLLKKKSYEKASKPCNLHFKMTSDANQQGMHRYPTTDNAIHQK